VSSRKRFRKPILGIYFVRQGRNVAPSPDKDRDGEGFAGKGWGGLGKGFPIGVSLIFSGGEAVAHRSDP
jgi:hypothetical protein